MRGLYVICGQLEFEDLRKEGQEQYHEEDKEC